MTSNVGSRFIQERAGKGSWDAAEQEVREALRAAFRPEFLNRVDDVIVFQPLGAQEVRQIVELQVRRVERILAEKKIRLALTPAAKDFLAEVGYDPAYGARPLKRAIQEHVQNALARRMLEGDLAEGDTVVVDRDPARGGLVFSKGVAPVGAS